jgi:hypothetical protein
LGDRQKEFLPGNCVTVKLSGKNVPGKRQRFNFSREIEIFEHMKTRIAEDPDKEYKYKHIIRVHNL